MGLMGRMGHMNGSMGHKSMNPTSYCLIVPFIRPIRPMRPIRPIRLMKHPASRTSHPRSTEDRPITDIYLVFFAIFREMLEMSIFK